MLFMCPREKDSERCVEKKGKHREELEKEIKKLQTETQIWRWINTKQKEI